jgi:hypothetical protein
MAKDITDGNDVRFGGGGRLEVGDDSSAGAVNLIS